MAKNNKVNIEVNGKDNLSPKLKGIKKETQSLGSELKELGINSAKVVGAGLAALTVQSIQLDGSFNKLQNQIGASAEEMKGFKKQSKEIYSMGLGESIDEVNQGLSFYRREMKLVGDELKKANIGALTIAKTFDKDINEVARESASLMKNFGISAEKSNDITFAALQKVGDGYDDLLDTAQEYSGQFAKAGYNAQDMFNILIKGSQDGVFNIDKVGDAVKEFGVRVVDGSKGTTDAFASMGLNYNTFASDLQSGNINIKDSMSMINKKIMETEDPIERNQLGVALYGTMWEDAGEKAIFNLTDIQDQLGETDGKVKTATDSIQMGFNASLREVNMVLLELVEPFKELIMNVANSEEGMAQFKEAVTITATALGGIMKVIGLVAESFWVGLKVVGDALGYGLFKIIEFTKSTISFLVEFKNSTISLWNDLKNGTIEKWQSITTGVSEIMANIKGMVSAGFTSISSIASAQIDAIVAKVMYAVNKVKSAYASIKSMGSTVGTAYKNLGANIKTVTSQITGARAGGGDVQQGKTYLVGENGPEKVTFGESGTIEPNGSGGGINVNFYGNLGNDNDRQSLLQELEQMIARKMQYSSYGVN